jgi:hypothetical protein
MPRRSSNPLDEHVQRLQAEQERLKREMALAEKALRRKPKAARPALAPERRHRLNNVAALDLPRPQEHIFRNVERGPARTRPARRRKTDARYAQIKFLVLCLLLAALLVFLWRNLPA